MSPVQSLHAKEYDPTIHLRKNKMGQGLSTLNTLYNRKDQNYIGNKRATKLTGVHLRKLEQGYMKEQREVEENLAQPSWLINNAHFCYDGDSSTNNENEKKILSTT